MTDYENIEMLPADALESREPGDSGAGFIGVSEISGLVGSEGDRLQAVLEEMAVRLGLAISKPVEVGSQSAMLALDAGIGDVAIRTDTNRSYILGATPASVLSNWLELRAPSSGALPNHGLFSSAHPDVDATDAPADGEVLVYDEAADKWQAKPAPPPDDTPQASQSLTRTSQITATKSFVPISSGSPVTISSTPTIAAGTSGKRVRIYNSGSYPVSLLSHALRSGTNLKLNELSLTLDAGQSVDLFWSAAESAWKQEGAALGDLVRRGLVVMRDEFALADVDSALWSKESHTQGRGSVLPANVSVVSGQLRLATPAGSLDGAEIKSALPIHRHGSYTVRMRACPAVGSLTSMFLYVAPDFHSEIDIELFARGAGDWRANFVTYEGPQTNPPNTAQGREVPLPFDPSAAFHDYRFDYHPEHVSFFVDGKLHQVIDKQIPWGAMHLFCNLWWPSWLSGAAPGATQYAYFEFVEERTLPDAEPTRPHGPSHALDGNDPLDGKATGLQRVGFQDRSADAAHTVTINDPPTQFFNAPALTDHRNVTLARPPAGRYVGQRTRVVREAPNTLGPWELRVFDGGAGQLRAILSGQWADFEWGGSSWALVGSGWLY